jgi:predicted nuclease of predicted toxin-antitoxin system
MNLVADESIDQQIVDRLRQDGHQVLYEAETSPGAADDQVLDSANRSDALLITSDKDFGELVFRQGRIHAGVVLIRLAGLSAEAKSALVSAALRQHGAKMRDSFSVISRGKLRIRKRM